MNILIMKAGNTDNAYTSANEAAVGTTRWRQGSHMERQHRKLDNFVGLVFIIIVYSQFEYFIFVRLVYIICEQRIVSHILHCSPR